MAKFAKFLIKAAIGGFLLLAALAVIGAVIGKSDNMSPSTAAVTPISQSQPTSSADNQAATPIPAAQPAADTQIVIPSDEAKFIQILQEAAGSYGQAANDMQKGAVRHQRAEAICNVFPTRTVTDWIGTIRTLDSTDKGNGVLTLQLAQGVTAGTNNNEISDTLGTPTLIPVNSALFQKVSGMKVGDVVRFSGTFESSDSDCFELTDLTGDGSVQSPDFIVHFDKVDEATQ